MSEQNFNEEVTVTLTLDDDTELECAVLTIYEVDGKVYFGEMTFFHCSGMVMIQPEEWNKKLGDWVILPEKQSKERICV